MIYSWINWNLNEFYCRDFGLRIEVQLGVIQKLGSKNRELNILMVSNLVGSEMQKCLKLNKSVKNMIEQKIF